MCSFALLGIDRSEPSARYPKLHIEGEILNCRVKPTLRSKGGVSVGLAAILARSRVHLESELRGQYPGDLDCNTWDRDLRNTEKLSSES